MSRRFRPGHDWHQVHLPDSHLPKKGALIGIGYSCKSCGTGPVIRGYSDVTSLRVCAIAQGFPESCDEKMVADMMTI